MMGCSECYGSFVEQGKLELLALWGVRNAMAVLWNKASLSRLSGPFECEETVELGIPQCSG
jgi:hypothetical protein